MQLVRLVLAAALIAAVLAVADLRAVLGVLRAVDLRWVLLAAALAALDRLLVALRWRGLLVAAGLRVGPLRALRVQLLANFLGTFLPGSLGVDAVRATALYRGGESGALVLAATLVDRLGHVAAGTSAGALALLLQAAEWLPTGARLAAALSLAGVACTLGLLWFTAARGPALAAFALRLPLRVRGAVQRTAAAFAAYAGRKRALGRAALFTLVILAVRVLCVRALVQAAGAQVPLSGLLLVIPLQWLLLMLPITIGGFGLQELGYVSLLGLLGVPAAVAVSVSLLEHVVVHAVVLPGALFTRELAAHPGSVAAAAAQPERAAR
jgi:uncharacterized protein (TIRG00374 family)